MTTPKETRAMLRRMGITGAADIAPNWPVPNTTYVILQRAITGKFVPDGGEHIEYDDLGVAVMLAEDRSECDGFERRVVEFASGKTVWPASETGVWCKTEGVVLA